MTKQHYTRLKSYNTLFVIVFFLVLSLGALYFFAKNDKPHSLKIGYSPYTVNLPLFVASEIGLFASSGITAELIPFQSTEQMTVALRSGQIDLASAPSAESIYAINAKNPDSIRPLFFNIFSSLTDVDAVVVPGDSEIQDPRGLKGKTIGVLPSNMMRVALEKYLSANHIDIDEVKIITFPPSSIISAIASKGVDAAYILDPLITISQQKFNTKILAANIGALTIADPLPAGFHCIRSDFALESPEIAQKLILIFSSAAELIGKDKSIAVRALQKYAHLPAEIAEKVSLSKWAPYTKEMEASLRAQFDALRPNHDWSDEDYKSTKYVIPHE